MALSAISKPNLAFRNPNLPTELTAKASPSHASDAHAEADLTADTQSELVGGEIAHLTQALADAQDAANLLRAAQDSHDQVATLLENIRATALAAAEADAATLAACQTQIQSDVAAIASIASAMHFSGALLLDGSAGITTRRAATPYVSGIRFGSRFAGGATISGPITLTIKIAATTGQNAIALVTAPTRTRHGFETTASVLFSGRTSTPDATGIQISDTDGNAILLTQAGNTPAVTNQPIGEISAHFLAIPTGLDPEQSMLVSLGNVLPSALGTGVIPDTSLAQIDVTTPYGARNAVMVAEAALMQVTAQSAQLGAIQSETLQPYLQDLLQRLSAFEANGTPTGNGAQPSGRFALSLRQNETRAVLCQGSPSKPHACSLLL